MPSSPLLKGVKDLVEVLRIVHRNPILQYSESGDVWYPLKNKGWATYGEGRWRITPEGHQVLKISPKKKQPLPEFFDL